MKILVYADPHWSMYSSILRENGKKYTKRLENLIQSINWVEQEATNQQCDCVVCLGDFFDKAELNAQEITALQEIKWADCNHTFLVGNHEISGVFNSTNLFGLCPNVSIIDTPQMYEVSGTEICFLPYTQDYKPLKEYFGVKAKPRIIFSHNDIKSIQMGQFVSQTGFDLEDIQYQSNYFINGHLHNFSQYCSLINLGNITGQNFGEDGFKYPHRAMVIDIPTLDYRYINNPYAIYFYKLEDVNLIEGISNAVITIKCDEKDYSKVKDLIKANQHYIIASRVIVNYESKENSEIKEDLSVDHLTEFQKYIKEKLGTTDIVNFELQEICR